MSSGFAVLFLVNRSVLVKISGPVQSGVLLVLKSTVLGLAVGCENWIQAVLGLNWSLVD